MSSTYLGHILGITNGKTWLVLVLVSGGPGATEGFRRASTFRPLLALVEARVEHVNIFDNKWPTR